MRGSSSSPGSRNRGGLSSVTRGALSPARGTAGKPATPGPAETSSGRDGTRVGRGGSGRSRGRGIGGGRRLRHGGRLRGPEEARPHRGGGLGHRGPPPLCLFVLCLG